MTKYAISLEQAHVVALGFHCAGRDSAEFALFVTENYSGLSVTRLFNAYDRIC